MFCPDINKHENITWLCNKAFMKLMKINAISYNSSKIIKLEIIIHKDTRKDNRC